MNARVTKKKVSKKRAKRKPVDIAKVAEAVQGNAGLSAVNKTASRDHAQAAKASERSVKAVATAEERLATFLLNLSQRHQQRGFAANEFFLSMSRQEIGSFLGLALETVSRLFTRFQEDGILKVERKHIEILDRDQLASLAIKPTGGSEAEYKAQE